MPATIEHDFFLMEKESSAGKFERRKSFRDIQGVVSKMKPDVIKTVIANASLDSSKSFCIPSKPKPGSNCGYEDGVGTAPLTIFYNGKVSVFDVAPYQAHDIIKHAAKRVSKSAESSEVKRSGPLSDAENLLESLNRGLPIQRSKSLQVFLQKRRERVTMSPYGCPNSLSYSGESAD